MSSLGKSLSEHHRRCDRLFALAFEAAAVADWRAFALQFAAASDALGRHMGFEESELFPAIEESLGRNAGPVELMRAEHDRLRELLGTLSAAAPQLDPDGCRAELEHLRALLERHNAKEETILYPACEQLLGMRADLAASAQWLSHPAP